MTPEEIVNKIILYFFSIKMNPNQKMIDDPVSIIIKEITQAKQEAYEEVLKIVMDLPELESEQANEDGYNDAMNLVTHAIRKFIKDAK